MSDKVKHLSKLLDVALGIFIAIAIALAVWYYTTGDWLFFGVQVVIVALLVGTMVYSRKVDERIELLDADIKAYDKASIVAIKMRGALDANDEERIHELYAELDVIKEECGTEKCRRDLSTLPPKDAVLNAIREDQLRGHESDLEDDENFLDRLGERWEQ